MDGITTYADMEARRRLAVERVNELLNKGSKPENLATSTPVLFMEPPTPAGMERVRQHLSQSVSRHKKPWWRFW